MLSQKCSWFIINISAFMAHYFCARSNARAHRCFARQRQAAVMALFLTGMINDGAHTANGPGETRFYQTEKEGGERETEAETEVRGGELGLSLFVLAIDRTAQVSLSKARSLCQLQ